MDVSLFDVMQLSEREMTDQTIEMERLKNQLAALTQQLNVFNDK
jgi:uncharacterized coiled-coil protein SlyX